FDPAGGASGSLQQFKQIVRGDYRQISSRHYAPSRSHRCSRRRRRRPRRFPLSRDIGCGQRLRDLPRDRGQAVEDVRQFARGMTTTARSMTKIDCKIKWWPTQAGFWLEWGSGTDGVLLPAVTAVSSRQLFYLL